MQQLPEEGRAVVGVAGQQLVQERGARAPEAGHDDGGVHGLGQDGGLLLPEVDHAQAVLQDELELAPGADASRQVEACLRIEGGDKRRKGSSHQSSPKSSSPVVLMAAACRTSGCSDTIERPSSPRPCPSATIFRPRDCVVEGSRAWGAPYLQRGRMAG